jgi:ABC-type spermidine/putrescine transport system permease subunit II
MTARTVATPAPPGVSITAPRFGRRRRRVPIGAAAFVALVLAFLFAPLVVVVLFSFHSIPRMSLPIEGLSLRWYETVFSDAQVRQALQRSVVAAIATALVAGPLGILAAIGLQQVSARTRSTLMGAMLLPIALPGLLLAVALAIYWRGALGLSYSLTAAVVGHILLALPFVVLTMNAAVSNFRFSLLEAARDLGATPFAAFRTVMLPIIRPAVEGAMLLSAAISIDELIVTLFIGGRDTTLPVLIWGRVQRGVDPSLNALATTLLVATTILALLAARRTTVRL